MAGGDPAGHSHLMLMSTDRSPLDPASAAIGGDEAAYGRACTLIEWHRNWEARDLLRPLVDHGYELAKSLMRLGWAHLGLRELDAARSCAARSVALAPDDWEIQYALGEVLRASDPAGAQACFARALELSPDNVHCLVNLSAGAIALKNYVAAVGFARHAIAVSATNAPAWINLGVALMLLDRLNEAGEAIERGETLSLETSEPLAEDSMFGSVLQLMGRTAAAIEYFENVLPKRPSADSSGHYALSLLTVGRFREGWAQYEFRWFDARLGAQRASYEAPPWTGQDLRGKTILLRCEQGVGDVLQFIRYAPMVKALGTTVWLELRPGLEELAGEFEGVDRLLAHATPVDEFDFYADLMSLPGRFGTTLNTIPASIPYLSAPESVRKRWRSKIAYDGRLKIGLVWAGDPNHVRDKQRSMSIETLAPLLSIDTCQWISLQKGPAAEQLTRFHSTGDIIDLGTHLHHYADTAAVIEQLDLILTVDTSIAHLAGAIGKPVWIMLPFVADWRWLEGRDDSPWYPTMRLFRQDESRDWATVVACVHSTLTDMIAKGQPITARDESSPRLPSGEEAPRPTSQGGEQPVPAARVPRACRARRGMIQYFAQPNDCARSLECYGEYLEAQTEIVTRLVRSGAFVVEVGAGIGLHTIALASAVAPNGNVLAFENSRTLRRVLRQNLNANGIHCVEVIETMIESGPSNASDGDPGDDSARQMRACSIDGLQLGIVDGIIVSDPSMVEPVLHGTEHTVWRHRPSIFLAMDSYDMLVKAASKIRDLAYRCWKVESPMFNPRNFYRRPDDLFVGAVALSIAALPEERDPLETGGLTSVLSEIV